MESVRQSLNFSCQARKNDARQRGATPDVMNKRINRPDVAPLVFLTAVLVLGAEATAYAARPLIIDDADPLEFKQFKLEGGAYYEKDGGGKHWDFPFAAGAGVLPSLEIGLGFGGQFEELTEIAEDSGRECITTENGVGDLMLAAKWQFLKETTWIPRQAIVPAVKFPTASKDKGLGSGEVDYDLTWIASKSITGEMGAHLNLGYAFIGRPADEDVGDIIHYGLALDYKIIEPLQWVGEVFAENETRGDAATVVMGHTGLRWNPVDTLVVDAAAGTRLAGDAPDLIATAGLTWNFGFTK